MKRLPYAAAGGLLAMLWASPMFGWLSHEHRAITAKGIASLDPHALLWIPEHLFDGRHF